MSLGNCIKHLYFWFFFHSVNAELNTTHYGCLPCHLDLSVFVSLAITLYIWRETKNWHLCCAVVVWSSLCWHRAHRVNKVSRAAHVWSPGPQPSDEQQPPQPPPPAAAARPGPHGLRPTRTSLQSAGPGSTRTFSERTPKTPPPSSPRPSGDG